jgi:hypothetical protein
LLCLASGLWQLWYLRRFFQRKKLLWETYQCPSAWSHGWCNMLEFFLADNWFEWLLIIASAKYISYSLTLCLEKTMSTCFASLWPHVTTWLSDLGIWLSYQHDTPCYRYTIRLGLAVKYQCWTKNVQAVNLVCGMVPWKAVNINDDITEHT